MAMVIESGLRTALRTARPNLSFDAAKTLAAIHGTPLLVVSRSQLERNYLAMRAAMPQVELFYAAKANPDQAILRTLCDLGCSIDVCSFGEAQAALQAGFTPERMLHTHPCKQESNLARCHALGLRLFVYDCYRELDKIEPYAGDIGLLLRLAMSNSASLIDLSAKFGAAPEEGLGLLQAARARGLDVKGLSFHVGSQCTSPDGFLWAFEKARRVWDEAADAGIPLEILDIGGGFPAPYRSDVLTLDEFCDALQAGLDRWFGDVPARIIAEPGRGLCADASTLVTRVIGTNIRRGVRWYYIDDGLYGSFSGKVFDHADFPLIAENAADRPTYPCVVAGPTCDSGDVVTVDQELPELEIGDLLMVPTMGAYSSASACPFNGLPVADTVAID